MRHVAALLFCLAAGELACFAQQFRVATWQVDRLFSSPGAVAVSSTDDARYNEVAGILEGTDADVIILYGVQESETAKRIVSLIKQRKYSLAHHTAFRHGTPKGPVVGSAVAILSRREKMVSKNIDWSDTGRIDIPGGFGFGVFRFGQSAVCLYVAGLPGSLTNGISSVDGKYFARKRNYAAQFLAHHATWLAGTYTNPVVATYLTGDFMVAPKAPVTDECAKLLDAAGFRALTPGVPVDKSAVSVTNSLELDRVQDPIFTRGVEFIASRQINRPPPEHPIIVCDLTLKAPATTAKVSPPTVTRPTAGKPAPSPDSERLAPIPAIPAPVAAEALPTLASATKKPNATDAKSGPAVSASASASTLVSSAVPAVWAPGWSAESGRRWLWWLAAGAFALGLVFAPRTWRRRQQLMAPRTATPNDAVYLEIRSYEGAGVASQPSTAVEGTVLRQASTATGHAEEARWRKSRETKPEDLHTRVMPHLRHLMRDQVVTWLSRQRSTLLESHELGTQQVLDLQAQLDRIKQQFQQRMVTQQQRISELDSALRSKEKLILDLLRRKPPEERG